MQPSKVSRTKIPKTCTYTSRQILSLVGQDGIKRCNEVYSAEALTCRSKMEDFWVLGGSSSLQDGGIMFQCCS